MRNYRGPSRPVQPAIQRAFQKLLYGLVLVLGLILIASCSSEESGYDRASWEDTFVEDYRLRRETAKCIMDGVEREGLQGRFASDSVQTDAELDAIADGCNLSGTERAVWNSGFRFP